MLRSAASVVGRTHVHGRRYLGRRYLSFKADTLLSPTPELLKSYLADKPSTAASAYLFSSIDPASIVPLLSLLQHSGPSIGSFSTPVPGREPSLSVVSFDNARTFRTELSGRPGVQVGRYQRPDREQTVDDLKGSSVGESEEVRKREGWAGLWKSEEETLSIPSLKGVKARAFFLLTDGLPRPVFKTITAGYPGSSCLGLLTQPTPFITGRPYTLFHNNEIHSNGTVGLAIDDEARNLVDFGLQPLTDPFTVADAQGNLLLRLEGDSRNPTQTLMNALQQRDGLKLGEKDEQIFLKINDSMIRVISGDPSRGALSLDTEESLLAGQTVQFMHNPRKTPQSISQGILTMSALRPSDDADTASSAGTPRVVSGLVGFSEGGFIHDGSICTVPNACISWDTGRRN